MEQTYSDEELSSDDEMETAVRQMNKQKASKCIADNDTGFESFKQSNPQIASMSMKVNFSTLTPKESSGMSNQAQNKFITSIKKQDGNRYYLIIKVLENVLKTKVTEPRLSWLWTRELS